MNGEEGGNACDKKKNDLSWFQIAMKVYFGHSLDMGKSSWSYGQLKSSTHDSGDRF